MKRIVKVVVYRVMHSKSRRKFIVDIIVNDIILALNDVFSFFSDEVLHAAELCYVQNRFVESSFNVLMSSENSNVEIENTFLKSNNIVFSRHASVFLFSVESRSIAVVNDSSSELFELIDMFDVEINQKTQSVKTEENLKSRKQERCICSKNVSKA